MSIDASLALGPKAILIWFDSRLLDSPNNCCCRVLPATTPAIDDLPVVIYA